MKPLVLPLSVLILAVSACTRSSDFVMDRQPPPLKPLEVIEPGALEGKVVNRYGGENLKDVVVSVRGTQGAAVWNSSTNALGEYQIPGLTPGMYTVSFARGDLAPHSDVQLLIVSNRRTYYHTTMTVIEQKETFDFNGQELKATVDVLFVIDNSTSMTEEQARLGSALSSFIPSLGAIDWQIGITTTDTSDGRFGIKGSLVLMDGTLIKYIDKNTYRYEDIFRETVKRDETLGCDTFGSECPSGDERPLEAIQRAIDKRNGDNAGFFREGADLAVVVLSDEDERSSGGYGAMTAQELKNYVTSVFGSTKTFSAYGILIKPGDEACLLANGYGRGYYGTRVTDLANLTGGVTGSICDADFGPALTNIGQRVSELVKSITLQFTPIPETVQLTITPADPTLTWEVIGNQINFNHAPNRGTRIEVTYIPRP